MGRADPWDVGFLNMQTDEFEDLESENFGVLRLRRQKKKRGRMSAASSRTE